MAEIYIGVLFLNGQVGVLSCQKICSPCKTLVRVRTGKFTGSTLMDELGDVQDYFLSCFFFELLWRLHAASSKMFSAKQIDGCKLGRSFLTAMNTIM